MKKSDEIFLKFKQYIREKEMIPQGSAVIAALSGGSDSVCMLDLLNRLRAEYPFRLFAVHVDHRIRGDEALRDRSFAEELCEKMDIPCRVIIRDVPRLAKELKTGLEEAGSRARKEGHSSHSYSHSNC